jgi:hypothetical protein
VLAINEAQGGPVSMAARVADQNLQGTAEVRPDLEA